jgi:hypothetical protein
MDIDISEGVPSYQHRMMRKTEKHPGEPAEVKEKRKGLSVLAAEKKPLKHQFPQRLFRRH